MQKIDNKLCSLDVCTGCFACKQVCAKGAIHIKEDKGFRYPEIDASLCVDCGLCTKSCPVLNPRLTADDNKESTASYAIWNNNLKDRMNSSSGGTFSALADKTIERGGIVYGAAWDDSMQLRHIGVEDTEGLEALRRSKYVQSNTDGIFKDVKQHLKTGRLVLFCGTPCQIAGLLSFLGNKDFPNLITVGVVCHGVPSQRSFDKYIREIEEEKHVKVYECNFRSKKYGWCCGLNLLVYGRTTEGKEVVVNKYGTDNPYFNAFLKQYFLRDSCYNCPFKEDPPRYHADIMLADSWYLWNSMSIKEIDFGKGISAVVTYTCKGQEYLKQCSDAITILERPYSDFSSNTGLRRARKPQNNDKAFEYLQNHSWKETQSMFFPLSITSKLSVYSRFGLGENNSILIKKAIKKLIKR